MTQTLARIRPERGTVLRHTISGNLYTFDRMEDVPPVKIMDALTRARGPRYLATDMYGNVTGLAEGAMWEVVEGTAALSEHGGGARIVEAVESEGRQ